MKRILSLLLVAISLLTLCSCGKDKNRILYNLNLGKYVELGDYKNIKIDLESKEYKESYNTIMQQDVEGNKLYVKKTDGKVADGDLVNIDYEGKKDGVAFAGGTAKGYDLEIGSKSFIDGFESGLVGVEIGSTVDLDLTFPKDYGNEELNGAAVVFTVKVNYVTTDEPRKPEDYYKDLKYASVEKYYENVKQTAIEWTLLDKLVDSSKVKEYPKQDLDYIMESSFKTIETNIKNSYGVDLETYLSYVGQTKEQLTETLEKEQVKPMMDSQMAIYAVFDKEKLSLTQKDIDAQVNKIVKEIDNASVTAKEVKEYYGDYYFEDLAINAKVVEFLLKSAKIS